MRIIIPYVLFVSLGIYGIFATDFVLGAKDVELAIKYCSIPAVIIGALFSYKATFGYNSSIPKCKNMLGVALLTLISTMTLLASFQGYILTINKFGEGEEVAVQGEVVRVNEKVNKNGSKSYSIDIIEGAGDTIRLKTPHGSYVIGSIVKEPLIKGRLGILYK